MPIKPAVLEAVDDGAPWHVRLTVVWRDEDMPVPISTDSRGAASSFGVRLATRPGSCVAHFVVRAPLATGATAAALEYWEAVVDEAALPRWEIVSFSIDQVDDTELAEML